MKYNLGEEEDLTHHGTSLSTIEKFEKPINDDDSDSDDDFGGKLAGLYLKLFIAIYCKFYFIYSESSIILIYI